jgi:hypothetical protein
MDTETINLIALGVGLAVVLIVSFGHDTFGQYTLKRNPNSLLLPLFFERLLKTKWRVIEFVVIVIWMIVLYPVGLPFGVVLLLVMVLFPITVSLLGRILKANIWKDDKSPSMIVA